MKYMKPNFEVTEFEVNTIIAACTSTSMGVDEVPVYNAQRVICGIGGQEEYIFSSGVSGCEYSASRVALGYYDFNNDGTKEYYFCWYADTGSSSKVPDDEQKKLMAAITGVSDPRNWHYCAVTADVTFVENFSFSY